jgi:hypothetical protein
MTRTRRLIGWIVAASLGYASLLQGAQAGMIGTEQLAAAGAAVEPSTSAQQRLLSLVQRDDVARALRERGVSPQAALDRVATLTDDEAAQVAAQIDAAPAGGDVLGVLVFIFVLLLVTDILGLTKVFPFTRAVR